MGGRHCLFSTQHIGIILCIRIKSWTWKWWCLVWVEFKVVTSRLQGWTVLAEIKKLTGFFSFLVWFDLCSDYYMWTAMPWFCLNLNLQVFPLAEMRLPMLSVHWCSQSWKTVENALLHLLFQGLKNVTRALTAAVY